MDATQENIDAELSPLQQKARAGGGRDALTRRERERFSVLTGRRRDIQEARKNLSIARSRGISPSEARSFQSKAAARGRTERLAEIEREKQRFETSQDRQPEGTFITPSGKTVTIRDGPRETSSSPPELRQPTKEEGGAASSPSPSSSASFTAIVLDQGTRETIKQLAAEGRFSTAGDVFAFAEAQKDEVPSRPGVASEPAGMTKNAARFFDRKAQEFGSLETSKPLREQDITVKKIIGSASNVAAFTLGLKEGVKEAPPVQVAIAGTIGFASGLLRTGTLALRSSQYAIARGLGAIGVRGVQTAEVGATGLFVADTVQKFTKAPTESARGQVIGTVAVDVLAFGVGRGAGKKAPAVVGETVSYARGRIQTERIGRRLENQLVTQEELARELATVTKDVSTSVKVRPLVGEARARTTIESAGFKETETTGASLLGREQEVPGELLGRTGPLRASTTKRTVRVTLEEGRKGTGADPIGGGSRDVPQAGTIRGGTVSEARSTDVVTPEQARRGPLGQTAKSKQELISILQGEQGTAIREGAPGRTRTRTVERTVEVTEFSPLQLSGETRVTTTGAGVRRPARNPALGLEFSPQQKLDFKPRLIENFETFLEFSLGEGKGITSLRRGEVSGVVVKETRGLTPSEIALAQATGSPVQVKSVKAKRKPKAPESFVEVDQGGGLKTVQKVKFEAEQEAATITQQVSKSKTEQVSKTKQQTAQETKARLDFGTALKTRFATIGETSTRRGQRSSLDAKSRQRLSLAVISIQNARSQALGFGSLQATGQTSALDTASLQATATLTQQKTIQQTAQDTVQETAQTTISEPILTQQGRILRAKIIEELKRPPVAPGNRIGFERSTGGTFDVFTRKGGKEVQINTDGLGFKKAVQRGQAITLETARASFEIREQGSTERVREGVLEQIGTDIFRESKVTPGRFVQRRSKRISSVGEKAEIRPKKRGLFGGFQNGFF